jgi:peptidoglycan/xylan/chitin deacetylase (PgdA/CDA1 family)
MKAAKALPILMYHHVSPSPGLVTVSPENFRAQMRWLAEHGWHTIGTRELEDFLAGQPLPHRAVMLTFDDGYLDNFVHAFPVLREYGLKAVIFVITGLIGEGEPRPQAPCPDHKTCKRLITEGRADEVMLRFGELKAMQASGHVEIQSHSHSHLRWDLQYPDPATRLARLAEDLQASRETLMKHLGHTPRHLCWPWGHLEAGYRETATRLGFGYQYTVERGTVTPRSSATALPRIAVRDEDGGWLARQCMIYRSPTLARLYGLLRTTP